MVSSTSSKLSIGILALVNAAQTPPGASLETIAPVVHKFDHCLGTKDFREAGTLLADNIRFDGPFKKFESKEEFIRRSKKGEFDAFPIFGDNIEEVVNNKANHDNGNNNNNMQIKRKGTKKMGPFNIPIIQTIEVNDDGLIQTIIVKKA